MTNKQPTKIHAGTIKSGDTLLQISAGQGWLEESESPLPQSEVPAGPGNTAPWLVESCNTHLWLAEQLHECMLIYTMENLQLNELSNSNTVNPLDAMPADSGGQ